MPENLNTNKNNKLEKCILATEVLDVIKEIPQQGQVQYSLQRQLQELRVAANKLGLYDAADFITPHCYNKFVNKYL